MRVSNRPDPLHHPAFLWLQGLLWPDAGPGGRRYAVATRRGHPRLVVPLGSPAVVARALRRTSGDVSVIDVAIRTAASGAARAGLVQPFLRARFETGDGGGLETWLAHALEEPRIDIVATIGPPRPNRKPVLQLFRPTGETLGFAKVGWNGLTRKLVGHEAEVLRRLGSLATNGITPPTLLHAGRWHDLEISILSPVGPTGSRHRVPRDPTTEELIELAGYAERTRGSFATSSYRDALDTRVRASEHPSAVGYAETLDELLGRFGGTQLEFGFSHGDWTPWNMAADERHLFVWDWERARPDVPVLIDTIHYTFQRSWLRKGRTPMEAVDAATAAAHLHAGRFGLSADAVDLSVRLYLLELCLRYAENAADGTDELRAGRHTTVEATLRDLM